MSRAVKLLWRATFAGILAFVLLIIATNYGLFGPMPSVEELKNPTTDIASEIFAEDGTLMGKYFTEDRTPVEMKDISKYVVDALVATEDKRFYQHSGIDAKALGRSVKGVVTFRPEGGGSTITQQLALNLFGEERATGTWLRFQQKLKEWIIAVKLERNFTKDEIITYYLNTVPFSENVYGIRNASITFFQKEPSRLNVEEAALLIAMVNGPSLFNPNKNPVKALERRNLIFNRMVVAGKLSATDANILRNKPIQLNFKKVDKEEGIAPYLRENVLKDEIRQLLKNHVKANGAPYDINKDGLKIYTSINPSMQAYAELAVATNMALQQKEQDAYIKQQVSDNWAKYPNTLERLIRISNRWRIQQQSGFMEKENRKTFDIEKPMKVFVWNTGREKDTIMTPLDSIKYTRQFLQAGFMAMDPNTGWVKAWVGGINYKTFKLDHTNVYTKNEIGGIIKPLLYSQCIEEAGFTPETPYIETSQRFPNYITTASSSTTSQISMWHALTTTSTKQVASVIMKQIGPQNFVDFLEKCNIQTKVEPYPSVAMGAFPVSLYEALWMYTMFPSKGFNTKPQIITRIEDHNGNILVQMEQKRIPAVSEITAYSMAKLMEESLRTSKGKPMSLYNIKAEMSGQMATINQNDTWFIGYTPELLCGAWVGLDDHFMKATSTATQLALPICGHFLQTVYADKKLGFNENARFSKPFVEKSDIMKDWIDSADRLPKELPVPYRGNGKANDYIATDTTKSKNEAANIHL